MIDAKAARKATQAVQATRASKAYDAAQQRLPVILKDLGVRIQEVIECGGSSFLFHAGRDDEDRVLRDMLERHLTSLGYRCHSTYSSHGGHLLRVDWNE